MANGRKNFAPNRSIKTTAPGFVGTPSVFRGQLNEFVSKINAVQAYPTIEWE
jgi:hypothetical protein